MKHVPLGLNRADCMEFGSAMVLIAFGVVVRS